MLGVGSSRAVDFGSAVSIGSAGNSRFVWQGVIL